ncbi:MAG: hypothetical protein V2J11_07505 [Desulfofustis sp.]|jgi:hypothetical protein|nr:hypothetical protein [Desulfofustis sp.]
MKIGVMVGRTDRPSLHYDLPDQGDRAYGTFHHKPTGYRRWSMRPRVPVAHFG